MGHSSQCVAARIGEIGDAAQTSSMKSVRFRCVLRTLNLCGSDCRSRCGDQARERRFGGDRSHRSVTGVGLRRRIPGRQDSRCRDGSCRAYGPASRSAGGEGGGWPDHRHRKYEESPPPVQLGQDWVEASRGRAEALGPGLAWAESSRRCRARTERACPATVWHKTSLSCTAQPQRLAEQAR